MTSDPNLLRRRANSAATRNGHARGASKLMVKPKSIHTSDEFLQDFLGPSFDPAAFLNAKLPPLAPRSSSGAAAMPAGAVPLADLTQQANALLSQLSAQTTRLSSTLTQLTDDILRSGSRLAYQVELLRGETLSLNETLHETLQEDIAKFLPEGIRGKQDEKGNESVAGENGQDEERKDKANEAAGAYAQLPISTATGATGASNEPTCVQQLRTLTLVRSRLEDVVKIFGDAMDFGFPPSEVSVSSSFLSVSAPEPGSDQQSSEAKGQQNLKKLRDEISSLLRPDRDGGADPIAGIERAANRIEELKTLNAVWRGTAEEKGRSRFIESLAKMVEDRHKELMREMEQQQRGASLAKKTGDGMVRRTGSPALGDETRPAQPPGGFGLISQLQKLRSGL
ncbi:hypothetical protein BBO_00556 [Beauveria brongniartii RCEF 3172]|uniref:Uncharacterized protein n=1 Tax=Beauveria brongniartii RCEF 3172 TaxID=1081107 RepID=A0A162I5Z0_9HYPO|nr:hypothetical protein BBO_00556 [Beauveria brongniartii RCEF 3172]